jgi:hypothetical protein
MSRVSCPECSQPVSPDEVEVCPQCGYPIREVYYGRHEHQEEKAPAAPSPGRVPSAREVVWRALNVGCALSVGLLTVAVLLGVLLLSSLLRQC